MAQLLKKAANLHFVEDVFRLYEIARFSARAGMAL
jgi:hypothetical protein